MGENSEAWSKVGAFYTWGIDHMTRLHKCRGGGNLVRLTLLYTGPNVLTCSYIMVNILESDR